MTGRGNAAPDKASVRHANGKISGPVAGMLLAAAAAVTLIGILAGFLLYPAWEKQNELQLRYGEKSSAFRAELERRAAEKVDPDELEALLRRVPIRPERERFILDLKEIARKSGVEIVSLTSGSGANLPGAPAPDLLGAITEGSGAGQAPQGGSSGRQGGGLYEELRYELVIEGTYRQAADFVRGIGALDRLVTIPEWRVVMESSGASRSAQPLTMTMDLALYAGTGYEGKFPGHTEDGPEGGDDE